MNIEQLSYIVEVAKSSSLAKAATKLHISQSALSQAITRLENELNIKIFNRTRNGAILTKEGEKIIEKTKQALTALSEIKAEALKQYHLFDDFIRISAIPGLTEPIIETYLAFKNNQSPLKLEVFEKGSIDIIDDIINEKTDLGFIAINTENMDTIHNLQFTPLLSGNFIIYFQKGSPLANKPVIPIETIKRQTFVLYEDTYIKKFIADFESLHGPLNIVLTTTNLQYINNAVKKHGNVTIGHDISSIYFPDYLMENGKKLDLNGAIDTSYRFGWIFKKEFKFTIETKRFIEEINRQFINQSKITL